MATQRFTAAIVKNLRTDQASEDIHDANNRGLHIRIYRSGRKVWRMRYRFHGRRPILTLGEYPAMGLADARRAFLSAQQRLDEGYDPGADAQRERAHRARTPTVAEFADEYVMRYAKVSKKTWQEDRRVLDKEVIPHIGKMRIDEIHRRDLVAVIDRIRDRGVDTMANRVYAVIRKMLNFAVERGVIDLSPAQQIKQTKETRRDVVLPDDAIRAVWTATAPYDESATPLPLHHCTRLALRLLLLTGTRNSEVGGIALSEIDRDRKLWTLPAERAKNGVGYTIPLSDMAMDTIEAALEIADDSHLFPSYSKYGHITKAEPTQGMQRLFAGRYRPHDLRRTVATRLSELGFNRLIVDKCLNHKDGSIGGIYDRHSYDKEKRAALEAWARSLNTIITGEKSRKVVPIGASR